MGWGGAVTSMLHRLMLEAQRSLSTRLRFEEWHQRSDCDKHFLARVQWWSCFSPPRAFQEAQSYTPECHRDVLHFPRKNIQVVRSEPVSTAGAMDGHGNAWQTLCSWSSSASGGAGEGYLSLQQSLVQAICSEPNVHSFEDGPLNRHILLGVSHVFKKSKNKTCLFFNFST